MIDPRLIIPQVAGIQCDVATLEAAIAEAEQDMIEMDRKAMNGDWFDHPGALIPIGNEDVEE